MVKELIAKLKDASDESRGAACEELRQFARSGSATIEDAVALIEAATGEFPAAENVPSVVESRF